MTSLTVVTAWQGCHELAPAYWRAMEAGLHPDDRVLVIDNGSSPPLANDYLQSAGTVLPAYATFLRSEVNLGFNAANNAGLERVDTEAVAFLNNDISLGAAGWATVLRKHLRPGVLVGASLKLNHATGTPIPYLEGWCVAGMTQDLRDLGGWSGDFEEPAYFGDVLLSWQAKRAGMKLVQADVPLSHLGNYTTRKQDVSGVSERNRLRLLELVRPVVHS